MLSKIASSALFVAATQALSLGAEAEADAYATLNVDWNKPDFVSTIIVAETKGDNQPKFLCIKDDGCGNDGQRYDHDVKRDVKLCYGDAGDNKTTWQFFWDDDDKNWIIRNKYVSEDSSCAMDLIFQKNDCGDLETVRSGWSTEHARFNLIPSSASTFQIQDARWYSQCEKTLLRSGDHDSHVEWWHIDGNRTSWQISMPRRSQINQVWGKWVVFASGSDTVSAELTREVSVVKGTSNSSSNSQGFSISVGAKFEGTGVEGEVTATTSFQWTETNEITNQLASSDTTTCKASCPNKAGLYAKLWQYQRSGLAQTSSTEIKMSTCHYACTYDTTTTPSCVPAACLNDACSSCAT